MKRGILSAGGYVPYHRLDRSAVADFFGGAPGRGQRSVASYDEDTTSMGVEAARFALASSPFAPKPAALYFATADPAYLDKTNATAIHAALRMDTSALAVDMGGAPRSGIGALRAALEGSVPVLVVSSDRRSGLPTSPDESSGGDAAAALLVGEGERLIAEYLGGASATDEFLDRWRLPGERRSKAWEERFAESRYLPLGLDAWQRALEAAHIEAGEVERLIVTGTHPRSVKSIVRKLGIAPEAQVDDLTAAIGQSGTAHAALLLTSVLESAESEQVVVLLHLSDGADALVFRTTPADAKFTPARPVATQVARGGVLSYGKFLSWRGMVEVQPPNRPLPARPSGSAAARSKDWKFAFVGSQDRTSGALHLPPQRASRVGGAIDEMEEAPMADKEATVATFTIDRLAYSPSPPVVFAVLDFEGGGRLPCELTDVAAEDVQIGDRVEMTFRRLYTADGIHNYFWKARPVRG
ncbi:MAG: OB-fold domain-containing protein [Deltaproteobacteria bacterium]